MGRGNRRGTNLHSLCVQVEGDPRWWGNHERWGTKDFFYGSLCVSLSSRIVRGCVCVCLCVCVYTRVNVTRARVYARRSSLREMLIGDKARSGQKPARGVQGLCVFLFLSLALLCVLPDICCTRRCVFAGSPGNSRYLADA